MNSCKPVLMVKVLNQINVQESYCCFHIGAQLCYQLYSLVLRENDLSYKLDSFLNPSINHKIHLLMAILCYLSIYMPAVVFFFTAFWTSLYELPAYLSHLAPCQSSQVIIKRLVTLDLEHLPLFFYKWADKYLRVNIKITLFF